MSVFPLLLLSYVRGVSFQKATNIKEKTKHKEAFLSNAPACTDHICSARPLYELVLSVLGSSGHGD